MTVDDLEIPLNATIRQEFIRCGNPDCQNSHGPYLDRRASICIAIAKSKLCQKTRVDYEVLIRIQ
jgi:hypothetical protein